VKPLLRNLIIFPNLIVGLGMWLCQRKVMARARRGFALHTEINSGKLGKNNN